MENESNFTEVINFRITGQDYEVYKQTETSAREIFLKGLYGKTYKKVRARKKLSQYNICILFFGLGTILLVSTYNAYNLVIYGIFFLMGFALIMIGLLNFVEVYNAS